MAADGMAQRGRRIRGGKRGAADGFDGARAPGHRGAERMSPHFCTGCPMNARVDGHCAVPTVAARILGGTARSEGALDDDDEGGGAWGTQRGAVVERGGDEQKH